MISMGKEQSLGEGLLATANRLVGEFNHMGSSTTRIIT